MSQLTEDEFDTEYGGVEAPDGSSIWQWADVQVIPVERVWTVVDGEDGNLWAMPGFHIVNQVGYLVSKRPWTRHDIDVALGSGQ